MGFRDDLRAETVGAQPKFPEKKYALPSGKVLIVRMPSAKEHAAIRRAANVRIAIGIPTMPGMPPPTEEVFDLGIFRAQAVARCTYAADDTGGLVRVFEEADIAAFLEQPSTAGWFSDLADLFMALITEAATAVKPSPATPTTSGS